MLPEYLIRAIWNPVLREPEPERVSTLSQSSSRPAIQSSIKNVKRLVIDAQGVVETSQSTHIAQFFTLYRSKRVLGPSLAFYEELHHVFY